MPIITLKSKKIQDMITIAAEGLKVIPDAD
jgi:hypothetical protein